MTEQNFRPEQQTGALNRDDERELRARALKRLKDKRDLKAHILAYVTVNLMLVGIWAVSGGGFFWPAFPILGWGIGLSFHVWDVVSPEPGPREIEAEMNRLRARHTQTAVTTPRLDDRLGVSPSPMALGNTPNRNDTRSHDWAATSRARAAGM